MVPNIEMGPAGGVDGGAEKYDMAPIKIIIIILRLVN